MAQACLHAAVGYQMRRFVPYEERIFPAIIFGAMLPDLDIIAVAAASLFYPIAQSIEIFHRTFSHSFFTLIIVYLVFAIFSEIKKKPLIKTIGKGIALGMLSHILIDTLIWFHQIDLLWPLPIGSINFWRAFTVPPLIYQILLIFEFFLFRWYAWFLIKRHLDCPGSHSWFIKYLNTWKNIETILLILFIFLTIWNPPYFNILFATAYIPSLIMSLFSTYKSRDALEFNTLQEN